MMAPTVYATRDLHTHWNRSGRGIARVLTLRGRRDPDASPIIDNGDLLTESAFGAYIVDRPAGPHPILDTRDVAGHRPRDSRDNTRANQDENWAIAFVITVVPILFYSIVNITESAVLAGWRHHAEQG